MNAGAHAHGVERGAVEAAQEQGTAEVRVLLTVDHATVAHEGFVELFGRHADASGEFKVGRAANEVARAGVVLENWHVVDHRLIEDEPGAAAVLVADLLRQFFGKLVGEAFALVVDEDRAVDAHLMRQDETGKRKRGRMNRHGVHVDCSGPHVLGKKDAVARGGGGVGGLQALRVACETGDHRLVCAEAARCDDHGGRINPVLPALRVEDDDAVDAALGVGCDSLDGGAGADGHTVGFDPVQKGVDDFGPDEAALGLDAALGNRAVLIEVAGRLKAVVAGDAEGLEFGAVAAKPFNGFARAGDDACEKGLIGRAAALADHVALEQLELAGFALRDAEHEARGKNGVASNEGHLLDDDYLRARFGCGERRRET